MTKLTSASYVKIALVVVLGLLLVGAVGFGSLGGCSMRFGGYGIGENMGSASIEAGSVENLSIAWASGTVDVDVVDGGDTIEVVERASRGLTKAQEMRWSVSGGTLSIDYGSWFSCFSLNRKDLEVRIPRSCAERLGSVRIDGSSGRYDVKGLSCEAMDLKLASGEMSVSGAKAQSLSLDVASGRADVSGDFSERVGVHTASGQTRVSSGTCPLELDADVASGFASVALPAGSQFAARVNKASGSFTCAFPATQEDGRYVVGSGGASFNIHLASGDFRIDQS